MAQRTCSIDGCTQPANARLLCNAHYGRARYRGTLDAHPLQRFVPGGPCSVKNCTTPAITMGFCAKHYQRIRMGFRTPKNVGTRAQREKTPTERFWEKVAKTETCWIWEGCLVTGYGRFWVDDSRRRVAAHRYAYELLVGEIPAGHVLDHLCENRACVRPDHLEPVTQAENIRRSYARLPHETVVV